MVAYLVQAGANCDARDRFGNTPRAEAKKKKLSGMHPRVVQSLSHMCRPDAQAAIVKVKESVILHAIELTNQQNTHVIRQQQPSRLIPCEI